MFFLIIIFFQRNIIMGYKDFFSNTFLRMDMFSASPTFMTRKKPSFQTIFGGILSFLIMGIFSYILYIQLNLMFENLSITYTEALAQNISMSDQISDLKFAVSIEGIDLRTTPGKFLFKLIQVTHRNGTTVRSKIQLASCSRQGWQKFGTSFQTQFDIFKFEEMLCIKNGQPAILSGFPCSLSFDFLQLQIWKCDSALDVSCDTISNVNSFMSTILSTQDYFNVKMYVLDTIISPEVTNPITRVIQKNIFLSFTQTLGTTGFIIFSRYTIQTDDSPWPYQSIVKKSGTFIEKFHTNAVARSGSKYISLSLFKSTKSLKINRVMGKFDSVLSYVGGLFGILFGFISFMIGSYSQRRYQMYVAESLITDNKGNRIKVQDFNFFTYIFYSIYDWLDAFGIAPEYFSYYKRIHQIREQSNQNLDPVFMLKRITYLQNTCKNLLKEKEQKLNYIISPKTTIQSKKFRFVYKLVNKTLQQLQNKQLKNNPSSQGSYLEQKSQDEDQLQKIVKIQLFNAILYIDQSRIQYWFQRKQKISFKIKQKMLQLLSVRQEKQQENIINNDNSNLVFIDPSEINSVNQQN